MPKAKSRPVQPVAPVAPTPPVQPVTPTAPTGPSPNGLPVIYPKLEIDEYSTASPKGPLDAKWWKQALGWETEPEYQARMVAEKGGKPEHYLFGDLGIRHSDGSVSPIHCRNLAGEKVVCKHNSNNRPFDMDWCEKLIHSILYGQWAGPFTIPGETVNCETVRIGRYGHVISGQHEGTAVILADEWLAKARQDGQDHPDNPKYPVWRKLGGVFIETIVCKGCSEDPRILMTVDYVKPRSVADVFYTSEVFKSSTPPERKELCRILASEVDVVWNRTDAQGYKTHPELVGFLDRHKRLLDCALHLFAENSAKGGSGGRKISSLRLQPGTCAALCYLMAASATKPEDSDVYRNMTPPSEKGINFDLWDKAQEFWTLLAGGRDFMPVRTALGRLIDSTVGSDDNQGQGGRAPEKLAILAKAWEIWKDHPATVGAPFSDADLAPDGAFALSYTDLDDKGNRLPDGEIKLLDLADFQGIDCPEVIQKGGKTRNAPPAPPPLNAEQIKQALEEAEERRRKAAGHPPATTTGAKR